MTRTYLVYVPQYAGYVAFICERSAREYARLIGQEVSVCL